MTNLPPSFVSPSGVAPAIADESRADTDRQALSDLAAGQLQALAALYDRHAASLFRHAMALSGQRAEAEDLVQATFLKLTTTRANLGDVKSPAGYLHRMLHSTWIDLRRRAGVGDRIVDQTFVETSEPGTAMDDSIDIRRALGKLVPAQRQAIVLHLVEGLSFREIGRATGVSLFTAAARYRLGIARLRTHLVRSTGGRS